MQPDGIEKNIGKFRFVVGVGFVVLALSACGGGEEARGPVIQPKKEATWVKTEKVRTTKEEAVSGGGRQLAAIPVNLSLAKQLAAGKSDGTSITDRDTCLAKVEPLDKRRTTVQKAGGMWHAFERNAGSKPYSFTGMQLDSNTNKVIHRLKHLCQTAAGVPVDHLANKVSKMVEEQGREGARKIFLDQGQAPEDVDKLLQYAEIAQKESRRTLDFPTIGGLVVRAEPLIDLYEDLSGRPVDAKTMDAFLSDSTTLLHVLKEFLGTDPSMVMASREDNQVPYTDPDQDM